MVTGPVTHYDQLSSILNTDWSEMENVYRYFIMFSTLSNLRKAVSYRLKACSAIEETEP